MQTVGSIIRERRRALGLSLAELAAAVDCSKGYLSGVETGRLGNPPSRAVLERLERALEIAANELIRRAQWQRTPAEVRAEVAQLAARSRSMAALLDGADHARGNGGKDLDALYRSGQLRRWLDEHATNIEKLAGVGFQVPLINKVAAGYPSEFTDLDYPARVADEYVAVPDVFDAQAFAARVVGRSMDPDYREGDVIVFSPAKAPSEGDDCFARLLPDHHTTFKRVFFEADGRVRLQPLNPAFAPQVVEPDAIAGLYPAVYRLQRLGA